MAQKVVALADLSAVVEAVTEELRDLAAAISAALVFPEVFQVTGTVGTVPTAQPITGQTTVATTAVRLATGVPDQTTNGVLVQALKANTAQVYVGGAGVTTTTGFELQPGQAIAFTCNLYDLAVVGANTSDKVCWSVV